MANAIIDDPASWARRPVWPGVSIERPPVVTVPPSTFLQNEDPGDADLLPCED